jgi:hypothetical protein
MSKSRSTQLPVLISGLVRVAASSHPFLVHYWDMANFAFNCLLFTTYCSYYLHNIFYERRQLLHAQCLFNTHLPIYEWPYRTLRQPTTQLERQ